MPTVRVWFENYVGIVKKFGSCNYSSKRILKYFGINCYCNRVICASFTKLETHIGDIQWRHGQNRNSSIFDRPSWDVVNYIFYYLSFITNNGMHPFEVQMKSHFVILTKNGHKQLVMVYNVPGWRGNSSDYFVQTRETDMLCTFFEIELADSDISFNSKESSLPTISTASSYYNSFTIIKMAVICREGCKEVAFPRFAYFSSQLSIRSW